MDTLRPFLRQLDKRGSVDAPMEKMNFAKLSNAAVKRSDYKLLSPFFSIITVTKALDNNYDVTIASVVNQTCTDWELIVKIFSNSNDIDIHQHKIHNIKYISSFDSGIYDAMNQSLYHIDGRYIYFLNSGDILADPDVLMHVEDQLRKNEFPDLAWGYVLDKSSNNVVKTPRPDGVTNFYLFRKGINHQSQFFNSSALFEMGGFDVNLKCAADHDILTKSLTSKKYRAIYLDCAIAIYEGCGYSSSISGVSQMRNDYELIRKRYFKLHERIIYHMLYAITFPKFRYWLVNNHLNSKGKLIYNYIANILNR